MIWPLCLLAIILSYPGMPLLAFLSKSYVNDLAFSFKSGLNDLTIYKTRYFWPFLLVAVWLFIFNFLLELATLLPPLTQAHRPSSLRWPWTDARRLPARPPGESQSPDM